MRAGTSAPSLVPRARTPSRWSGNTTPATARLRPVPLRACPGRRPSGSGSAAGRTWGVALLVVLAAVAGLVTYHVVASGPAGSAAAAARKPVTAHKAARTHPAATSTQPSRTRRTDGTARKRDDAGGSPPRWSGSADADYVRRQLWGRRAEGHAFCRAFDPAFRARSAGLQWFAARALASRGAKGDLGSRLETGAGEPGLTLKARRETSSASRSGRARDSSNGRQGEVCRAEQLSGWA